MLSARGKVGRTVPVSRLTVLWTCFAGSAETQTQAGYTSGQVGVDTLLAAVPQLKDLADVSGEQVANVGSQDMSDEIWLKLAARVNALADSRKVDGIVITHGTDTMEETAYFLDLTVTNPKPVIMVGNKGMTQAVIAETDRALKGSKRPPDVILQTAVLELCADRR